MTAFFRTRRGIVVAAIAVVGVSVAVGAVILRSNSPPTPPPAEERGWVKVDRVVDGDTIKVEPDDKVVYACIRAPSEGEPLFEEAKARNAKLVEGKKLRLRFDGPERDKKGRLLAYAFLDDRLVNATLVREGLAYVRVSSGAERFVPELLAAQVDARQQRRGLWNLPRPKAEASYRGDSKYGNFHRVHCAELAKIDRQRLVDLASPQQAFDRGFAPCPECKP